MTREMCAQARMQNTEKLEDSEGMVGEIQEILREIEEETEVMVDKQTKV